MRGRAWDSPGQDKFSQQHTQQKRAADGRAATRTAFRPTPCSPAPHARRLDRLLRFVLARAGPFLSAHGERDLRRRSQQPCRPRSAAPAAPRGQLCGGQRRWSRCGRSSAASTAGRRVQRRDAVRAVYSARCCSPPSLSRQRPVCAHAPPLPGPRDPGRSASQPAGSSCAAAAAGGRHRLPSLRDAALSSCIQNAIR